MRAVALGRIIVQFILAALFAAGVASAAREGAGAGPRQKADRVIRSGRIAFESDRDLPNRGSATVYLMNADGSGQHKLDRKGKNGYQAAWSPNGRRIALRQLPREQRLRDLCRQR